MELLGSATIDFQVSGDQPVTMPASAKYIVRRITLAESTAKPVAAAGGVYSLAGQAGNVLVPASQTYASLADTTRFLDASLGTAATQHIAEYETIYFNLTDLSVNPATALLTVWGDILP